MKGWYIYRKRISVTLACIVAFVTAYLLVLPAITLDQNRALEEEGIALEEETSVPEEETEENPNEDPDEDRDEGWEEDNEGSFSADEEEGDFGDIGQGDMEDWDADPDRPFTLTEERETYAVTASYGEDAELPEDISLSAEEIEEGSDEYVEYYNRALAAVRKDKGQEALISHARFFDISFLSQEAAVEPAAPVSIAIDYDKPVYDEMTIGSARMLTAAAPGFPEDAESMEGAAAEAAAGDGTVSVVHFAGPKDTEDTQDIEDLEGIEDTADPEAPVLMEVETEEKDAYTESVTFESDSFSVYGVIVTSIEKTVLAGDGHNYRITAECELGAGIPADAELSVEEITEGYSIYGKSYEDYVASTQNALGIEEGHPQYLRLFEISIVKDGETLQPAEGKGVAVRIELADSSSESLSVVHFPEGSEEGEAVESSTESGENGAVVEFRAGSFSVYSIVEAPEPVHFDPYNLGGLSEIEENNAYQLYYGNSNYFTATVNNKGALTETNNSSAAADWYFEKVDEEGSTLYIYTIDDGVKKYIHQKSGNEIELADAGTAFVLSEDPDRPGMFLFKHSTQNLWLQHSGSGGGIRFWTDKNNAANSRIYIRNNVPFNHPGDAYDLDGHAFGIAYNDDSTRAAAMMAATGSNQNRLAGLDMLIRNDVLSGRGNLLVAENSDIQEWTFEHIEKDTYYIKTTVGDTEKYLHIQNGNVKLVDDRDAASAIQAIPGTDSNAGKWHFTVGGRSLNYTGNNDFNAAGGSEPTTWLNLVERSPLSDDDFVEYTARKISASDDILSATKKDDNGQIMHDDDGNVVYRENKAQVVIYTRVWNETTKKYEFYAVDHDGTLIRVYDSGDQIIWIGDRVNSALWEFTEYTNADGTPSYYYELENTAYTGTYLAPQSDSLISRQPVGVNLNGRRDGYDYSSIVAWDDPAYAYSGLKVEEAADGSLRVVTCPLDEAADFHFAVITLPVEEADDVTTVETVDNEEFGISIKMIDFNNRITGDRDSVQKEYLGPGTFNSNRPYVADTGLVSTNLEGGYPKVAANTPKHGQSLAGLFSNMTPANHLFIQSVYNESGYFEYDSTQNFAHLNDDGTFTVYNQLGAIGTSTGGTRAHGQFMPYNDISAQAGYAHDTSGNIIRNQYNIRAQELPDTEPRKGEPLYSIPQNDADYYFGMELSAVFTQTPDGVDNWGHDIIFEFTGDDDFWFYVDGELVLDLGGVHSAIPGSVNFRTGEVNCNGTVTSLYEVFKSNYRARGKDESLVDNLFVTKTVNGKTVHVFNDYTTHEMKMFYMERGKGASNLKMRFNLASVKPGTVELSKKLEGVDNTSNKLIQYPYQIWYQTAEYLKNEDGTYVLDDNGQRIITSYDEAKLLEQPAANTNLTGRVYAVYKGTKKLIPYRSSMNIGGIPYNHIFLLRAGETAVINFPENTFRYKLVECGVDTSVYQHVYVNGGEIFGQPHHNGDLWDSETGTEPVAETTSTYDGTTRSDFGITYYTTEGRPKAEYTNQVPPEVMRTLSIKKVLYDSEGHQITDPQVLQSKSAFSYRLYLGNEFAEQENILPADMYTYYVKGPDGSYCKWDRANRKFVSLGAGVDTFEEFKNLSEAEQRAGTFTTSMYGSITNIPAGYTVEVRDLIVGTKYKIEEPDRELPKGYTRRDSDGYVRTDLAEGKVVYYTEGGTYGRHPEAGNRVTAEPISDTIASKTESPKIEVRNQEGWGLTAQKEWTDKDFIVHDPIYMAVYLDNGHGQPGALVEGSVRRLDTGGEEIYWFFPDLKIGDVPHSFSEFIVREVELEGTPSADPQTGAVTGYTGITIKEKGQSISVRGRTATGSVRAENYTVDYIPGQSTGQNVNIRTDTVKNSRPGLQIYKTDWSGSSYLSGAVFTLKDSEGHDVGHATYTSDASGLVTTAYLNEGTFTLSEIRTPTGYAALDEPITITVSSQQPPSYDLTVPAGSTTYYISLSGPKGFYTSVPAAGSSMARINVKNRTVQDLKVVKVGNDSGTRIPLEGVHFALYAQVKDNEGNVRPAYSPETGYEDLVTGDDGLLSGINMSLGAGTYYLREKAAPSGYKNLSEDLCFTIGQDGTVTIHNAGYSDWLTRDTSVPGTVAYQISIVNTPLGITLRKTDEGGTPLSGAGFTLCSKNSSGSFISVTGHGAGEGGLVDLTDKTETTFTGLPGGIYLLTETDPPAGCVILTKDIYFMVENGAVTLTDQDGNARTYSGVSLEDDGTTIVVQNPHGGALPHTGGPGTGIFTILGSVLTAGAGWLLWRRRKLI